MVKIAVVAGSPRSNSETRRIAEIVTSMLRVQEAETDLLSLRDLDLPLWRATDAEADGEDDPQSFWRASWPAISKRLADADGFVVMTPEWHGMAPAHLKNLFLCCNAGELAFKPAYLISISAGAGGAYPIAELRMSSYKNTYLHYLPDHLIIRNAKAFRPGEEGHAAPDWLEPRLQHGLAVLRAFAAAAAPLRRDVVRLDILRSGM